MVVPYNDAGWRIGTAKIGLRQFGICAPLLVFVLIDDILGYRSAALPGLGEGEESGGGTGTCVDGAAGHSAAMSSTVAGASTATSEPSTVA